MEFLSSDIAVKVTPVTEVVAPFAKVVQVSAATKSKVVSTVGTTFEYFTSGTIVIKSKVLTLPTTEAMNPS